MNLKRKTSIPELIRSFFSNETPNYIKLIMLAAVAYVISPIDLLPDIMGIFGFADDAAVVAGLFSLSMSLLDNHKQKILKQAKDSHSDGYHEGIKEAEKI
ncbi:hypothetical protein AWM75_00010 [Aerococcus urinaehominis]|uniref:Uncharacterized protein n=1 Tax=Aerococcus urinaehominis TaxID=128944 RepID=A0A109RHE8_9LACT|nr:DUF1232 domain-containing protein [Aerococcus urinaehominis]AMB98470.1 hypothetical protein AWM75_00010 [Aerococcus urinaehominis]SDL81858.1 Protein of unknown function [Aerococcus urinaehominis]